MARMSGSSRSGRLPGTEGDTDRSAVGARSSQIASQSDRSSLSDGEFDALVTRIRRWYGWDFAPIPNLADQIRRRLGLAPRSVRAVMFAALFGVGIRLAFVLLATALVGEWAGLPWSRWAWILGFFAVFEASRPFVGPPIDVRAGPKVRRIVEDWTALVPTIVRKSDLRDLAGFLRRWYRPMVSAAFGVGVATVMLAWAWWLAPGAMGELRVGTLVLLAWLLFDFGSIVVCQGVVVNWAFMAREAGYDHHLFWPSPADSPEVEKAMRTIATQGSAAGLWITVFLVLTIVLVSWESPLVVPLGVGFILIGYIALLGAAVSNRSSVQRVVQDVRERRLQGLRDRIDAFGPNYEDLSPRESQQLGELLSLHDRIRDAPATPTAARTVLHTAVGLVIPTLMFLATVFGEVYAERFLDGILP